MVRPLLAPPRPTSRVVEIGVVSRQGSIRQTQIIFGAASAARPMREVGMHDIVIRGGTIVDGTGKAAFSGDIAIAEDGITAVGSRRGPARRSTADTGRRGTPRGCTVSDQ